MNDGVGHNNLLELYVDGSDLCSNNERKPRESTEAQNLARGRASRVTETALATLARCRRRSMGSTSCRSCATPWSRCRRTCAASCPTSSSSSRMSRRPECHCSASARVPAPTTRPSIDSAPVAALQPVPDEVDGHGDPSEEEDDNAPGRGVRAAASARVREYGSGEGGRERDAENERNRVGRRHRGDDTGARDKVPAPATTPATVRRPRRPVPAAV